MKLWLKWGTLKGWEGLEEDSPSLPPTLRFFELTSESISVMTDRHDDESRAALCALIDCWEGEIGDWTGETLTKDQAKKYVMEYGKP